LDNFEKEAKSELYYWLKRIFEEKKGFFAVTGVTAQSV